ncbi:hypothetical protein [Niallia taxi]|uniref:hypothetical protein n=1 Tax=Niallia taxi TaxID=2499688 RepID=UPI0015F4B2EE|nr:hypothetical protein [Niallia taxi]
MKNQKYLFTTLFLGLIALFLTTGCSLQANSNIVPTATVANAEVINKEEISEPVEEEVEPIETISQADIEKQEAMKVGAQLVHDFFHLKGNDDPHAIGGLLLVHPDLQLDFGGFAWELTYQYLPEIIEEYGGVENTPAVKNVYVDNVTKKAISVNGTTYENTYTMSVAVDFVIDQGKWNHFEEIAVSNVDGEWKITYFMAPDLYDGTAVIDTTNLTKFEQ